MKVLISGASGLIGTELNLQLKAQGHEVVRLVRREARSTEELSWNPGGMTLDPNALSDIDAVINLAGATTGNGTARGITSEKRLSHLAMLARTGMPDWSA